MLIFSIRRAAISLKLESFKLESLKLKPLSLRFFASCSAIPVFIYLSVVIHEYGHVLGAKLVSNQTLTVYIWPGYELHPNIGSPYKKNWPKGVVAFGGIQAPPAISSKASEIPGWKKYIDLKQEEYKPITEFDSSIIALSGSGLNSLLSVISLLFIYIFKPKGIGLAVSVAGALLHYDLLLYSVLPIFFDLPHLIFWGGTSPEPIIALSKLGLPQYFSVSSVIFISAIQLGCLYKLLKSLPGN
ncbi:site-2 protease family protein [Aliikangiella coralliicola]|uniref:Peptidase M50 domain-containing protein n=1 Tax=Aliikangiella coralliicola TaxID=2592383 RepID=A0A545UJN9_9GAMM|nr:site-2 protease family protein [Aliikangiella coralliicola]TQV89680.1 hypothetical protein FLL46_02015 [Aliikangiella coralliicola]